MTGNRPVVMIALPSLGMGGAEQFLTSLANQLADKVDIHFYILSEKLALKDRLTHATIHSFAGPVAGIRGLYRSIKSINPDIILTSMVDLNLVIIALRFLFPAKVRIVVREASDPESALALSRFPAVTRMLYRLLYPHADNVICLSDNMRDEMLRILHPRCPDVSVISNGVGIKRMVPFPLPTPQKKMVLAIGRLSHEKGFDQLILAFAAFVKTDKGLGYQLVIVGDGPLMKELQDEINAVGANQSIHLKGFVKDPVPLLSQASFLALPSRFEGVSNVMLEALVNGVPVLATKERTSAELYIDGDSGVLVGCCQLSDIFSGIQLMDKKINSFDRTNIAEKWRARVSLDVIAGRYLDVFESEVNLRMRAN